MTADVISMQAEADAIAARRADTIRVHPSTVAKQCPPQAGLLHRIASLITTEDLPAAKVTVTPAATHEVLVDLTGADLVENGVRRWAAALGLIVTDAEVEVRGFAARRWIASGFEAGMYWRVQADELLPTPVRDAFGVGVVAE